MRKPTHPRRFDPDDGRPLECSLNRADEDQNERHEVAMEGGHGRGSWKGSWKGPWKANKSDHEYREGLRVAALPGLVASTGTRGVLRAESISPWSVTRVFTHKETI
ncbi:uncharacterized protein SPSK_04705 [Sporothrix schenckii 1099-18]|uniref:Uncharacterized protein n=1 Tax=Sporothrix schenckii 1099-18 TaxID=1397361 RepID=A0A0F2M3Y7_SPOSC|nr:uncharacterized protein SPSK_04705 [Sporothrix schenckii 1099-18]KJR82881.1 hypothetical protein SPSK_04705 [Sporothrix schenckii 1099-18]